MGGILTGGRVFVGGHFQEIDVVWDDEGIIQELVPHGVFKPSATEDHYQARGRFVLPGLIDTQVRLGTDGFAQHGPSLASGGITCVVESNAHGAGGLGARGFSRRLQETQRRSPIDFALCPDLSVDDMDEFSAMAPMAAAFSVAWNGAGLDHGVLRELFARAASAGRPVIARCLDPGIARLGRRIASLETVAVASAIELAVETHCELHVACLSTARAVDLVDDAKRHHLPVTASVSPYHLLFTADDVEDWGTLSTPLQGRRDRRRLLEGVEQGIIDILTSDHGYVGNDDVTPGIRGVPFGPYFFTLVESITRREGIPLGKILDALTLAPAKVFRLVQKGEIEVGFDADFVILGDPDDLHELPVPGCEGRRFRRPADLVLLRGRVVSEGGNPRERDGGQPVVFEPPRYWNS